MNLLREQMGSNIPGTTPTMGMTTPMMEQPSQPSQPSLQEVNPMGAATTPTPGTGAQQMSALGQNAAFAKFIRQYTGRSAGALSPMELSYYRNLYQRMNG